MSEVEITIDGKIVRTVEGASVLQAALAAGIDIPHLCWDPSLGLPPTGACRLCIVEVEGSNSPVTSCTQRVVAGMVVRTRSETLDQMRRTIIQLLLSDHPRPCPASENARVCALCAYADKLGVGEIPFGKHTDTAEPEQDSPALVYDRAQCVLCGRCVSVCHELQVTGAIDFIGRGYETRPGLPPGLPRTESACAECGNCIDACPTGALAFAGARGAGRAWELERTVTTCPYCGVGCTMVLHTRGNRIVQVTGEPGLGVNRGLLCVKGRFGFDFVHHPDRLREPLIRRDGELVPVGWEEALSLVAERLSTIKKTFGPDSIGALLSAKCTNEENYVMQKLFRAVIGTNNVDHCARLCHASTVAGLARAFGSGAMTNPIDDLQVAELIFVIGSNTTECHPVIGSVIKRAARRGTKLIVADPRAIELTEYADLWLRHKHGTDVALINAMAHVILRDGLEDREFIEQRTEGFDALRAAVEPYTPELAEKITGVPAADITRAAHAYAESGASSIVYSMGITQHTTGTDNVLALANLAMLTGNIGRPGTGVNPLRGQNNVQGACDVGALPDLLPGYQKVEDPEARATFEAAWGVTIPSRPGLTVVEMVNAADEGTLKALYVMGENPVLSDPDADHVEKALKKLEFLVVQDVFLNETARLADVVLPGAVWAEKDGTFTNTERRVQRVRKAVEPPGNARVDWEILSDVAARLGHPSLVPESGISGIQDEMSRLIPQYAGVFEAADAFSTGKQWPCPGKDHPGTPILHVERFTRGLGKFHAVEFIPPKELPDEEYPFVLSTGRILEHYHTGTMSRRSEVLDCLVSVGAIEINPEDAGRLGIRDGGVVKVSSRRGAIRIQARVTERVAPGTLFLAFHYWEAPANRLTIAALDPIAKIPEFKVCAAKIEPE